MWGVYSIESNFVTFHKGVDVHSRIFGRKEARIGRLVPHWDSRCQFQKFISRVPLHTRTAQNEFKVRKSWPYI